MITHHDYLWLVLVSFWCLIVNKKSINHFRKNKRFLILPTNKSSFLLVLWFERVNSQMRSIWFFIFFYIKFAHKLKLEAEFDSVGPQNTQYPKCKIDICHVSTPMKWRVDEIKSIVKTVHIEIYPVLGKQMHAAHVCKR